MHDPSTVAFDIKYPWRKYPNRPGHLLSDYREPFITIWHEDPQTDGTDDSCGWFARARHGDQKILNKIVSRFTDDWDRVFTSDGSGNTYYVGYFAPDVGTPVLSPIAITVNLFFVAALETFGSRKLATKFMQKNLFEIIWFAENPVDSLHTSITQKYGRDGSREDRIRQMAVCIYGWILREQRPWYKHPRWHFWHWRFQIHPWQNLRRFLLTRCCKCGKGFRYGDSPCTDQWDRQKPRFLRGETGLYHGDCRTRSSGGAAQATT